MGIAAALGAAVVWAVASTFMASQTARVDTLSLSFIRAVWAGGFFVVALFALGGVDDLMSMSFHNMWQLSLAGFVASGVGETLFTASVALIGMARPLTILLGGNVLLAFVLSAIFLGETATWEVGIGAALVVAGVYLVALHGRPSDEEARIVRARAARAAGSAPARVDEPADQGAGDSELRLPMAAVGAGPSRGERTTLEPGAASASAAPAVFLGSARLGDRVGRIEISHWRRRLSEHRQMAGVVVALLAALSFASATVWLRAASVDVDATAGVIVRMPVILPVFGIAALVWPRSSLRRLDFGLRSMSAMALFGVLGTGASAVLILIAIQEIGAGQAVAVYSISPLIGLPLAVVFLRERLTRWAGIGTVVAVVGIVLIT